MCLPDRRELRLLRGGVLPVGLLGLGRRLGLVLLLGLWRLGWLSGDRGGGLRERGLEGVEWLSKIRVR